MTLALKQTQNSATDPTAPQAVGLFRAISIIGRKHLVKFASSPFEIIGTLFMPVLWMVLFGVCMGQTAQDFNQPGAALNYMSFITPGVMLLTGLSAAIMGGTTLLMERIQGTLKEYLVAPVPRLAILLGSVASGLTKSVGQAGLVLLLGVLLGANLVTNLPDLVLALLVVGLYGLGFVGIAAACACRVKGMESYHSLIILLNLPVLFVSNALYPLDKMPALIGLLAFLNPTTYAIDALRHLLMGAPAQLGLALDLSVLLIFTGLGLGWGYQTFRRTTAKVVG